MSKDSKIDKLAMFKKRYALVSSFQTDAYVKKLHDMATLGKLKRKTFDFILFNLLNEVITAAYEQGRKTMQ
jgi:hypothetical protein